MGNEKFLSDLRADVGAFTEADPYYSDIPVITERLKNIQGRIDQALGVGSGICLILVTPVVGGRLANVPGANYSGIQIIGRVLENTARNTTGKEALDVAIYTDALWSQARPDSFSSALRPNDPSVVLANDPKFLGYDVRYLTEGGTKVDIPKLDPPSIDITVPTAVVLAETTPGSAIFYSFASGTTPAPPTPRLGTLYTGPFDATSHGPPGATRIRARAWLAGYIPSPETTAVIS